MKKLSKYIVACTLGVRLQRSMGFLFRAVSGKAAQYLGNHGGFSLIEVLVALAILSFIGTGLLMSLETNSRATCILDEQVVAGNLAVAHFEAIKQCPYADTYPNAGDSITIPSEYSVAIDIGCSSDGITFYDCTGSENETVQKITVSVSRQGKGVLSISTYRAKR